MEMTMDLESKKIFNMLPICHIRASFQSESTMNGGINHSDCFTLRRTLLLSRALFPPDPNHFGLKKLPNFSSSTDYRNVVHQTYPAPEQSLLSAYLCRLDYAIGYTSVLG
jgi:hypothetical protein